MYKGIWIRHKNHYKDFECEELVTPYGNNSGAKNRVAFVLKKDITDLRFTPISLLGEEDNTEEYVVDYYGRIVACIIRINIINDEY